MDTKTKRYIIVAASVVVTLSAFLVAVLYSASKNGVNVPVKAAENLKEPDKTDIAENAAVMPDVTGMNYEEAQELLESMQAYAKEVEKATVRVTMKAGEGGKVFGSVSSKEIATEAKKQFGLDIDKKKIQLTEPIRTFGTTEVPVKLHPQVTATLKVSVTEA